MASDYAELETEPRESSPPISRLVLILLAFELPQTLIDIRDPLQQVRRGDVGTLRPFRQLCDCARSSVDQSTNTIHAGVPLRDLLF